MSDDQKQCFMKDINTQVKDLNGKPIYEGDRVRVTWTADLGIKEIDCQSTGTVRYMHDGIVAAFSVVFDKKYARNIDIGIREEDFESVYETENMELIQADEDMCVNFEILEKDGVIYAI